MTSIHLNINKRRVFSVLLVSVWVNWVVERINKLSKCSQLSSHRNGMWIQSFWPKRPRSYFPAWYGQCLSLALFWTLSQIWDSKWLWSLICFRDLQILPEYLQVFVFCFCSSNTIPSEAFISWGGGRHCYSILVLVLNELSDPQALPPGTRGRHD